MTPIMCWKGLEQNIWLATVWVTAVVMAHVWGTHASVRQNGGVGTAPQSSVQMIAVIQLEAPVSTTPAYVTPTSAEWLARYMPMITWATSN